MNEAGLKILSDEKLERYMTVSKTELYNISNQIKVLELKYNILHGELCNAIVEKHLRESRKENIK